MKQQIEEALDYDKAVGYEKQGNQMTRGRFYRNAKYKNDPMGRGRVQLRDGHLHSAIKSFEAALAHPIWMRREKLAFNRGRHLTRTNSSVILERAITGPNLNLRRYIYAPPSTARAISPRQASACMNW